MSKQPNQVVSEITNSGTFQLNRFCSIVFILVFCIAFFFNSSKWSSEKFSEAKTKIETHFASPPKEEIFKQLFYQYQKLSGRTYINNVTILKDGRPMIDIDSPRIYLQERSNSIIALNNYLKDKGTPFLYVRAPNKLRDNTQLPLTRANSKIIETGDSMLSIISDNNVDTLDLREEMMRDNMDFTKSFYFGDHHWTADTAFWAYGKVGTRINSAYGLDLNPQTWNTQSYDRVGYEKAFLGSESKIIGGPKEYIVAIWPKFDTAFEVSDKSTDVSEENALILASGNFIKVFTPSIEWTKEKDDFGYGNLNNMGDHFRSFKNSMVGGNKRVLLIADSFGGPFMTYLATAVETLDFLYLRPEDNVKLYPILEHECYDLVIFMVSDMALSYSNEAEFSSDRLYLGEEFLVR